MTVVNLQLTYDGTGSTSPDVDMRHQIRQINTQILTNVSNHDQVFESDAACKWNCS